MMIIKQNEMVHTMTFNIEKLQNNVFNINKLNSRELRASYDGNKYVVTFECVKHTFNDYCDAKSFIDTHAA